MDIFKYDIENPVIDRSKPFYLKNYHSLVVRDENIRYKYFIQCSLINQTTRDKEYYLLLSNENFNINCKRVKFDDYGRKMFKLAGEIDNYVANEAANRGNIKLEYVESTDIYDVFKII